MDRPLGIGALIHFRGSIGVVIDHDWDYHCDGLEPENFIRVYWHDEGKSTWEEWETNMKLFEVIG
tara:strand:+ start:279 stop:473 length:195 start_codon:yes stop_codon:yes gene_type:complete